MKFTPPVCKRFIINVLRFVVKPVTCQPAFFLLIYVLLNVLDLYSIAVFHGLLPLFKAVSGFIFCYMFCMPVIIMPSYYRWFYKVLILLFVIMSFVVDVYCILLYRESFATMSQDAVAAILATNPDEAFEFLSTYFALDKILVVLSLLSFLLIVTCYLKRLRFKWNIFSRIVLFLAILFACVFSVKKNEQIIASNTFILFTKECPDLLDYRQNPTVVCKNNSPENIVMILGESFVKSHSSLYGYEFRTNPLLNVMRARSELYVYNDVKSACYNTIPAVKSIMMSYTAEDSDSIEWYRCLTLIEVMQNSNYRTYWLSNQSKKGIYDNEVGRFADLCDEQFFVGNIYSGMDRSDKDEKLLPLLKGIEPYDPKKKFFVLQMMGSHQAYALRYPESFSKFSAEDYSVSHSHLSASNRKTLSEYDNSVLYNDSIVYEIMRSFEGEDAVVIYFSDHGQDVFDSSDDYAGHAKIGNEKSECAGRDIPFMVYTSPLFREKHPELQLRIENAVDRPYRTDSVMYTIMDVAGIETVNGVSYKHKSLFK